MFYDAWDSFEEVEDYGERTVSVLFCYLGVCGSGFCIVFLGILICIFHAADILF